MSCPINKCGFSAQEKGCGKARSAGNTLPYCQGTQRGHSPSPARPSGVGTIADRHSCEGAPRAFWLRAPLQPLATCPIFPADCALPSAIVLTLNHTYLWDRTLGTRPLRCRMARLRAYKRKGNRQISPSIGAQQSKLQSQKRPSHLLSN